MASDSGPILKESVQFEVTAPYNASKLKGITEATTKLAALEKTWSRLNTAMAQQTSAAPLVFKKSAADIAAAIKYHESKGSFSIFGKGITAGGALKPEQIGKVLGYDPVAVKNYMAQATAGLIGESKQQAARLAKEARKAWDANAGAFKGPGGAAIGLSQFTKHGASQTDMRALLLKALNPFYQAAQAPSGAATGAPAPNFGQQMAAVKAAQKAAMAGTSPRPSPQGGEGEDKAAKSAKSKLADARAEIQRKLAADLNAATEASGQFPPDARSRRQFAGYYRNAAAQMRAAVGGDDSTAAKKHLKWAEDQERVSKEVVQKANDQVAKQVQATVAASDQAEAARQKQQLKAAAATRQRQEQESRAALDPQAHAHVMREYKRDAIEQARIDRRLAEKREYARKENLVRTRENELKAMGARVVGSGQGGKPYTTYEFDEQGMRRQERIQYGKNPANTFRYLRPEKGTKDRMTQAMEGLSVRNLAANVLKVTEWAAAVGALYKTVELARYSLKRLEDTGLEMAHLSIVFRGVGGSVAELTQDMIQLAAAQGRDTSDTMDSAMAWARLGGSRKEINEEVRLSAVAANIAGISMAESTKQLQSLTHIYGLDVNGLNAALAGLVNTSLKYNVTLDEMFIGLDRSAAAAKVAGINLGELQAMIGVVVGATGQTGSMTGNSLKYIFQELQKPEVQKQMRGYGVEPLGNNLEIKPGGQILSELAGQWGTLGSHAQQGLSGLLGGRFNAARVPIIMQDMPRVLDLAVDSQLHLNTAQEANVKILDTMHAQLEGIKGQWDRITLSSQVMGPLTMGLRTGKNLLAAAGDAITGGATPDTTAQWRDKVETWLNQGSTMSRWGSATVSTILNAGTLFTSPSKGTPGLFDVLNYTRLPPEEMNSGRAGSPQRKLDDLATAATVAQTRTRAFDLAYAQLQNKTLTNDAAGTFAGMMQKMGGNGVAGAQQFMNAFQSGDQKTAGAVLLQFSHQTTAQELAAKRAAATEAEQERLRQSAHIDDLVAQRNALPPGEQREALSNQIGEANNQMALAKEKADALAHSYQDLAGEMDDVSRALAVYGGKMAAQTAVSEQLGRMFDFTPAVTQVQALGRELAAASTQLDYWSQKKKEFEADLPAEGSQSGEQIGLHKFYIDKVQAANQAVEKAGDPERRRNAGLEDRLTAGGRAGRNLGIQNDFGIDAGQKLLNQNAALEQSNAELRRMAQATTDLNQQAVIAGQLQTQEAQLWENKVRLAERLAEVNRDIKQLAIDQNKEFMRSFYGDGPAQMLQKLAAFRMAFNGSGTRKTPLSQGAFFGLSPEMRGAYGQLNPQYNPQMIELHNERNRITQNQNQWQNPAAAPVPDVLKKIMAQVTQGLSLNLPKVPDALLAAANAITSGGDTVMSALFALAKRIDGLGLGGAPAAAGVVQNNPMPFVPRGVGGASGVSIPHRTPGVRTF